MIREKCFNTQPPEGGWFSLVFQTAYKFRFQHTAARRRLVIAFIFFRVFCAFQHTAARRRLGENVHKYGFGRTFQHTAARRRLGCFNGCADSDSRCFNTQPPEGGWICSAMSSINRIGFNTQPPEGGWKRLQVSIDRVKVSTHSRPKAAGPQDITLDFGQFGFNTQPPEGGWDSFAV